MILFLILTLLCISLPTLAHTDPRQPCHGGACSYTYAPSATQAGATLQVWGHTHALGDITPAGGFEIVRCDPGSTTQVVELVCAHEDPAAVGCDHLDIGGALGKVVRLPEDCHAGPFAIVIAVGTAENQELPAHLKRRIVRRADAPDPTIRTLTLSSDFAAHPPPPFGPVSFALTGSSTNTPGTLSPIPLKHRRSRTHARAVRRGLFDKIKEVAGDVKQGVTGAAGAVADGAQAAADKAKEEADKAKADAERIAADAKAKAEQEAAAAKAKADELAEKAKQPFDKHLDGRPPPVNIDTKFNVFNTTINCGDKGTLKLSADATMVAHANVSFGLVAAGTLIPPKFDSFSMSAGLSADFRGSIRIQGQGAAKNLTTGAIPFFQLGIPGLSIPGIITVGPFMLLKARADMDIGETDLDLTATVSHNVRDASVSIPPAKDGPPPGGSTQPQDQDLKIAVSPGSQPINGSITIHLIPSLNFGVSAVIGQINTGLFVDFDSSTTFLLTPPATPPPPPAPGAVEKGYSGCVQILGGMVSTAGAVAKFFTFLDDKVTVPLFEKRFQMLSKCFEDGKEVAGKALPPGPPPAPAKLIAKAPPPAPASGVKARRELEEGALHRRATTLTCPSAKIKAAEQLLAEQVLSGALKVL